MNNQEHHVFDAASDIRVCAAKGTVTLEGAGFFYRFGNEPYSQVRFFRKEFHGADAEQGQAAVMTSGLGADTPVVFLRSSEEADALIHSISRVANAKTNQAAGSGLKRFQASAVEAMLTTILVCFLGAGMANLGWTTFQPLAAKIKTLQAGDLTEQRGIGS